MTTVIRRRRLVAVLFAVLGLFLSACSASPNQANAAAIVNGKTIGVDQVQDLVAKAVKAEPAAQQLADQRKLDELTRAVVRQLVLHEVIEAYIAKENLTIDQAAVTELASQLTASFKPLPADGTVPPAQIVDQAINRTFDAKEIARDYLAMAEIGRRQAGSLEVTFDFTFVTPGPEEKPGSLKGKAIEKANQMAAGLDEAAKVIDADIAAGLQAGKGEKLTPAAAPDVAGTVLFGAKENSVVVFQPGGDNAGWVVALIRKRDTNATPSADAPAPDARLATVLGPRLLQDTAEQLGIKISPRYGVWDSVAMAVAASDDESAGVVIPVKNVSP